MTARATSPVLVILAVCLTACHSTRHPTSAHPWLPLEPILFQPGSPALDKVLKQAESHRLQVLVTELIPHDRGIPAVRRYGYRVDAEYFYPASSIKLCAAVAALQTLESLATASPTHPPVPDLVDVPVEINPLFSGDARQTIDTDALATPTPQPITFRREIRKLALVSDNQAFNRLFDFVGHEALNQSMHTLGFSSVVLNHRLSDPRSIPEPQASAEVWLHPQGFPDIRIPSRRSTLTLTNRSARLQIGNGFVQGDSVVHRPMDFTSRNGISLVDLQNLLIQLVRPEIRLGGPGLKLTPSHRALLLQAMTEYPRESADPRYSSSEFPDHYGKFLLPGIRRVIPSQDPNQRIQVTGKIGRAYGFSVENACLVNPSHDKTVFVTVALYTNEDGILNDDRYEYSETADPFLEELGERIARHWLTP